MAAEPAYANGPIRGVFHCFGSTRETAEQVVDRGFLIAVGGVVTFPNADRLREAVRWTPVERLLLETDCPYLAPQSVRGRRNEPAYVAEVARRVAELKGLTPDAVAEATTRNAQTLFGLDV